MRNLAGAAAVALGLLLRSEKPLTEGELRGGTTTGTPGAGESEPAGSPGKTTTPAEKHASDDSPPAQSWHALVRAPVVVADFGPLPQPSVGLALGAGVSYEQWRFLLMGELWHNQTIHGADLPSYGADAGRQNRSAHRGSWISRREASGDSRLSLWRWSASRLEASGQPSYPAIKV